MLRIAGFDRIPAVSLSPTASERVRPALSPTRRRIGAVRRSLTARGMFEAVTWSFMPRQHAALFGDASDALVLANPINAELDAMRPSILPNLIEACRRNADRGLADAALFEIGPVYAGTMPDAPIGRWSQACGRLRRCRATGTGRSGRSIPSMPRPMRSPR